MLEKYGFSSMQNKPQELQLKMIIEIDEEYKKVAMGLYKYWFEKKYNNINEDHPYSRIRFILRDYNIPIFDF